MCLCVYVHSYHDEIKKNLHNIYMSTCFLAKNMYTNTGLLIDFVDVRCEEHKSSWYSNFIHARYLYVVCISKSILFYVMLICDWFPFSLIVIHTYIHICLLHLSLFFLSSTTWNWKSNFQHIIWYMWDGCLSLNQWEKKDWNLIWLVWQM